MESRVAYFFSVGGLFLTYLKTQKVILFLLFLYLAKTDLFIGATGALGETRGWSRCALKSPTR